MLTKKLKLFSIRFTLAFIIFVGMLGAKPAGVVHASTFVVMNTNDSGAGSLRQAIADAVSGDTITFDPSLDGQTILLNATLSIDKNLTFDASLLPSKISISGNDQVRVFDVSSDSTVVMDNLNITNGKSKAGSGILNGGILTIIDSGFYNNMVTGHDLVGDGGAINNAGTLNIINSRFYSNKAQYEPDVVGGARGGAIHNIDGNLTITNTFFADNSATWGGAISCVLGRLTITNSGFFANRTTSIAGYGGAIYDQACVSTVANSSFSNNSAVKGGAIFTNDDQMTSMTVTNSTFYHNIGSSYGGAISSSGVIVIKNSTFSENESPNGGAIRFSMGSIPYVYNSILANSTGGADCMKADSVKFSANLRNLIETTSTDPDQTCGASYLSGDPMLGGLFSNGTYSGAMALLQGSPAIDAGDTATCTTVDARGVRRPQGSRCDLGAVEIRDHIYVKWNATGANNGSSWNNAYTDLLSALSSAITGEEVWVAAGTYKPTTGTDRRRSFFLLDGVELYGGFLGTEGARYQRETSGKNTILSGDIGIIGDNSDNSVHIVETSALDNTIVLDGITITGGNAADPSFETEGAGILNNGPLHIANSIISSNTAIYGGGIRNYGPLTITNSILSDNSAEFGGGIWDQDSTVVITNSRFLNNSATLVGGAISKNYGSTSITNSIFSHNTAQEGGGGISIELGSLDITDSYFSNNSSTWYGGGLSTNGPLEVTGSTFINNSAGAGGGISVGNETANIVNSTFFGNTSTSGGGISFSNTLNVTNSTFSENMASYGGGIYNGGGTLNLANTILANSLADSDCFNMNGTMGVNTNNLIETNVAPYHCGTPALTGDPKLDTLAYNGGSVNTMALLSDSPAIDAGNDTSCPATDQRGVIRPQGDHCDIGAYEYEKATESEPAHPYLKSQALIPSSLTTQSGTTSGSLSSLSLLDQSEADDDPAAYVSFQTPEGVYLGEQSFFLPEDAQARLISTMLLQVNFNGPSSSSQVWTWSIYNPSSKLWIKVGDSIGTEADQWQNLVFRIRQPWRFISPGNEIRVQLKSNNANGDAKIDYQALHVTYLFIPAVPTQTAPSITPKRPGTFSVPNVQPTATSRP